MSRTTKLKITVLGGLLVVAAIAAVACTGNTATATPPEPGADTTATASSQTVAIINTEPSRATSSGDAPVSPAPARELTPDEIVAAQEALLVELYDRVVPSVVRIISSQGAGLGGEGSGFVWDKDGHIVTNYHVVQDARDLTVYFADGGEYAAEVTGFDPDADIAVIKIDAPASLLHPVVVGKSSEVKVGQMTVAIGNPFGHAFTMTTGIVSAVGRELDSGFRNYKVPAVIQTDAAINPGNSGGPLLDRQGRVIGINTQISSETRQNSGVGFAVPVDLVKRVVPSLIEDGSYEYAYLGIAGDDLFNALRERAGLPQELRGALLRQVTPGGPADQAGLLGGTRAIRIDGTEYRLGGDVIVSINGEAVRSMDDLIAYLALNTSPGDTVDIGVVRDGTEMTVDLKLGARPVE